MTTKKGNKRKKTALILLALLVVLIVAYVLVLQAQSRQHDELLENARIERENIISLNTNDVVRVGLKNEAEEFWFTLVGEEWQLEGDEAFPLDQTGVADLLSYACILPAEDMITEVTDLEQYGLAEPKTEIFLQCADGKEVHLAIGEYNGFAQVYYVNVPDEDDSTVYTIVSLLSSIANKSRLEWMEGAEIPLFTDILSITVTAPQSLGGQVTELVCEDDAWFLQTADVQEALDSASVESFTQVLQTFDWAEMAAYLPENTQADIDFSDPYRIAVSYRESADDTEAKESVILLTADGVYGSLENSPLAYTLDSDLLSAWRALGL